MHRLIENGRSHQNQRARQLCLKAFDAALTAIDPYLSVRSFLKVNGGVLTVEGYSVRLSQFKRVFLFAVGKASAAMTQAAVQSLHSWPVSGIAIVPRNQQVPRLGTSVQVFRASHPVPGADGLRAGRNVSAALTKLAKEDLLICMISGGASAMIPSPTADIALKDEQQLTKSLVSSRATIHDINTVRRHISTLKGGRLVQLCQARSILSLIISDVPGNFLPDIASGPTVADPTTFQDAINAMRQYGVWDHAPRRVKDHLIRGRLGKIPETPKPGNQEFERVHNVVVADNAIACSAAAKALSTNHSRATILTSRAEIEASQMGRFLAAIATDRTRQPFRVGSILIGGETTVLVRGDGVGGRNQETALSAVEDIAGTDGVVVAAIGTDGIDGNSNAAGAIVDGRTFDRAKKKGLFVNDYLVRNDSYHFFHALNDNLITGRTGTNVGDVYLTVRIN